MLLSRVGLPAVWNARRRVVLMCCALGLLLVLWAPGVARASGTLDQSSTDVSGGYASLTSQACCALSGAQTFTAGLTGSLGRVDLYLSEFGPPTAPLTVEIRDVSGGQPGSTVLASASVPESSVPTSPSSGWVEVDFASPAQVVAGTQYAIVAYTTETGIAAYYWWQSNSDTYSGGTFWLSQAVPPSTWSDPVEIDHAFKTYVSQSASTLAAKLVTDADHLAPGKALADKAAAIQTAVNAGQTATACADITNFLGLVQAQTGKKLTTAKAALLTTDATNLQLALGC